MTGKSTDERMTDMRARKARQRQTERWRGIERGDEVVTPSEKSKCVLKVKARQRKAHAFKPIVAVRLGELKKLIAFREGTRFVSGDDGPVYLRFLVHTIVTEARPKGRSFDEQARERLWQRVSGWGRCLLPHVSEYDVREEFRRALKWSSLFTSDDAATELRVTADERRHLDLRTIGALGSSADTRRRERPSRKRELEARRRRARGQITRVEYRDLNCRSELARSIGVDRKTIARWLKEGGAEQVIRGAKRRQTLTPTVLALVGQLCGQDSLKRCPKLLAM